MHGARMSGHLRRTGRDRDGRRPGHRPGARPGVRRRGRVGRRERHRRRARRHRAARRRRRRRSSPRSRRPAGAAVVNGDDVADWAGAQRLVEQAIEVFGGLDVVVNNAGFVRDRMFVSCSEEEWDAVVRVHLKGHFCVSRHAAAWWRDRSKARRRRSTPASSTRRRAPGSSGRSGQSAYSSAKAGIATLTLVQAAELGRYGVTANAIAPAARTRMTEGVFTEMMADGRRGRVRRHGPGQRVAARGVARARRRRPTSPASCSRSRAASSSIAEGWHHGPAVDTGRRWDPAERRRRRRRSSWPSPAPPTPSTAPDPAPAELAVAVGGYADIDYRQFERGLTEIA